MQAYVEHANVTVEDIEQSIEFIQTAIPEFKVRHKGYSDNRWCHIGTDTTYIALQEAAHSKVSNRKPYKDIGINHIGLVVEDADLVKERLLAAGYQQNELADIHPFRKRIYFFDNSGGEWEFIQYLSNDVEKRNQYEA